jgi:hypothetical protein
MVDEHTLPSDLAIGATRRSNEYGWTISAFPNALKTAELLNYACLGGQFQFCLPGATCEMYWLAADSSERRPGEDWDTYRLRRVAEVATGFQRLIQETDFAVVANHWPSVKDRILAAPDLNAVLTFVAYFVTEDELSELRSGVAQSAGPAPTPN